MALQQFVRGLSSAFLDRVEGARVVLIHARSANRPLLISMLTSQTDVPVLYYVMRVDDLDVEAFIHGFLQSVQKQAPTFGEHLTRLGRHNWNDIDAVLNAFTADLNDLSSTRFAVLLDEYDRTPVGDELQQFIEVLIDRLPAQCQLLISVRTMPRLPRLPWMSLIAQRKAIMLRDTELVTSDFYDSLAAEGEARLNVVGFGPGIVSLDGQPITGWEGHLPRLLFFFALERPVVTRSEICSAFWPDLKPEQAVNVFHVTKRRLHKALDVLGMDVLIHEDGYYRINPMLHVHYDVVDFVSVLVKARTETDKAQLAAWQQARELAAHPFLQGHVEDWIKQRRHEYIAGYIEATIGIAQRRIQENRPDSAIQLMLQAITADETRQDIHRDVMRLYSKLGRRSDAVAHFNRYERRLKERGIEIEPETSAVFSDLSRTPVAGG